MNMMMCESNNDYDVHPCAGIFFKFLFLFFLLRRYDELSISYGDVINIHDKQEDGWWLGECGGKVGIFPATYVEQI